MSRRVRLVKVLRSRRVAIWLLVGLTAYAGLLITLPGQGRGAEAPLFLSFSSPIFLVALVYLGISTAICAWERSRVALEQMRHRSGLDEPLRRRIAARSPVCLYPGPLDDARPLVAAALAGQGLVTQSTRSAVQGRSGRLGPLGSPLFHWALAALFALVLLGQVSRSEGKIGVGLDSRKPLSSDNFDSIIQGAAYSDRFADAELRVIAWKPEYVIGGIDRGPVPVVALTRNGRVLASSPVYPNHPLRYRSLLVHYEDFDYYADLTLLGSDLKPLSGAQVVFDVVGPRRSVLSTEVITLTGARGRRVPVTVSPLVSIADGASARRRQLRLTWADESGAASSTVLAEGATAVIAGAPLRFDTAGEYVRLSVADDWSVYPIYLVFFLMIVGNAISALWPRRVAWVLLTSVAEGTELRLLATDQRREVVFELRLAEALREMCGTSESPAPVSGEAST